MQKPKLLPKSARQMLRLKTGRTLRRYLRSLGFRKTPGAYEPAESPQQPFVPTNPTLVKPLHKTRLKGEYSV